MAFISIVCIVMILCMSRAYSTLWHARKWIIKAQKLFVDSFMQPFFIFWKEVLYWNANTLFTVSCCYGSNTYYHEPWLTQKGFYIYRMYLECIETSIYLIFHVMTTMNTEGTRMPLVTHITTCSFYTDTRPPSNHEYLIMLVIVLEWLCISLYIVDYILFPMQSCSLVIIDIIV